MFPKSIRWRLQLWLAFLLICVLSGFGGTIYELQRINQFKQIDEDLKQRIAALSLAVRGGGPPPGFGKDRGPFKRGPGPPNFTEGAGGPPPGDDGPGPPPPMRGPPGEPPRGPRGLRLTAELVRLFDQTQTNGFYFAAWSRSGTLMKRSTNAPAELPFPERVNNTLTHTRMRGSFREAYHFTEMSDGVLAGRSITADLKALNRFKLLLLAAGGTVLAFGLAGGWWLTTSAIRPIQQISTAASHISGGNLSERIRGADIDNEFGRLAGVLNSTFARLESAFAQQKQFTADASHELRTPLAVLIAEAQTTLARERSSAEYRQTVEACLDIAQEMRRLTESLLELARLDANQEQPKREPLDLADLARAAVERIRPLASQRNIQIHCDLSPANTLANPDQLTLVVTNLLTNAIHYNKPSGKIRVTTGADAGAAILTVADTGIGIGSEDFPHIFERFYRADKSRSRAEGRTGLGLAICKAIIDAHSASISVSSQPCVGTTFTVRLPPEG